MILKTGAILDKELSPGDYVDGRLYGTRGFISTFNPCQYCQNGCRRQTYKLCDDAYFEVWKKEYLQRPIDCWLTHKDKVESA